MCFHSFIAAERCLDRLNAVRFSWASNFTMTPLAGNLNLSSLIDQSESGVL